MVDIICVLFVELELFDDVYRFIGIDIVFKEDVYKEVNKGKVLDLKYDFSGNV